MKRRLKGFGAVSASGVNCPAGGDWDQWCNCMFPANEDTSTGGGNNAKCRSKPWGPLSPAPWTIVGATLRGIPAPGSPSASDLLSAPSGAASALMNVPSGIVWLGVGALAIGAWVFLRPNKRSSTR